MYDFVYKQATRKREGVREKCWGKMYGKSSQILTPLNFPAWIWSHMVKSVRLYALQHTWGKCGKYKWKTLLLLLYTWAHKKWLLKFFFHRDVTFIRNIFTYKYYLPKVFLFFYFDIYFYTFFYYILQLHRQWFFYLGVLAKHFHNFPISWKSVSL